MLKISYGVIILALTGCAFSANAAEQKSADTYVLGGVGTAKFDGESSKTSLNLTMGQDINPFAAIETSFSYSNGQEPHPYGSSSVSYYTLAVTPVVYVEPIPQLRLLAKAGVAYMYGEATVSTSTISASVTDDAFMFTTGVAIQYQHELANRKQALVRLGFDRYFHENGDYDNLSLSLGYKF